MKYIDAHCHPFRYVEKDYLHLQDEALKMLDEKGIFIVGTSLNLESYDQTLELAKKSPNILPAFGLFAHYALEYDPEIHDSAMERSSILSEIGLTSMNMDPNLDYAKMQEVFQILLEHAEKTQKIVICHISSEDEKALTIMESYDLTGVVIHGFRASHKLLNKIIESGYYVSAGFLISETFKDRQDWELWRSIARDIPMDLLLTETDGPAMKFGINSESVFEVVDTLAKLKKKSHQEIKETVFKNFDKLLRKDPKLQKYSDFLSSS